MKTIIASIALVASALLCACGNGAMSPGAAAGNAAATTTLGASNVASPDLDPNDSAAAAYCRQTRGEVEIRRPVYGSNSSNLLFLYGRKAFCQYTSKKDGSRIHILLSTLYTTKPTLAATAYIGKPPPSSNCNGNPASCYCTYLGGSDQFGGASGAGGGWYKKNSIDQTLEACIFPDMSSIDSWGLTYHAEGIIRGKDLEKVMRYKGPSSK